MGKMASRQALIWLENLLADAGVYSLCRDSEADILRFNYTGDPEQLIGEPSLVAVVSSWEDAGRLQKIVRQNSEEMKRHFGDDYTITHQFFPYFLSYLEMGRISSELTDRFFLSTKIVNHDDPELVELPYRHLEFDLKVTMIKARASMAEINQMREQIAALLADLNLRSRYLRIGEVVAGYAQSKFIFTGQPDPEYHPLPI